MNLFYKPSVKIRTFIWSIFILETLLPFSKPSTPLYKYSQYICIFAPTISRCTSKISSNVKHISDANLEAIQHCFRVEPRKPWAFVAREKLHAAKVRDLRALWESFKFTREPATIHHNPRELSFSLAYFQSPWLTDEEYNELLPTKEFVHVLNNIYNYN